MNRLDDKKITSRWIKRTLIPSIIIVIIVILASSILIQYYYYGTAEQLCRNELENIMTILNRYSEDSGIDYSREARLVVENFEKRDKMELMAIDENGNIITTSSGFEVSEKISIPDFYIAITNEDGIGTYRGKILGEKVLSITQKAPGVQDKIYAIRIAVSLKKMDKTISLITVAIVAIGIGFLSLQIIPGIALVHSIVDPLDGIGQTAKAIASGNFNNRLEKENDDEIGQLCDAINDMAQELGQSEKMKNDFISSVSHELRTPLTAIKGWSETLANNKQADKDTFEKGMGIIQSETDRLSQMVEELLDFSRIQSGRLKLVFEKMDILAELEEAVLMYSERAKRENIALDYEEQDLPSLVIGDHNRLRQVFINIIDNALKYSDAGGSVMVSSCMKDEYLYISIKDTGCGIAKSDLPNIKKKFYKANLTRRGNGIGLAVADEIVMAHKGELLLDSVEGKGTTVTIKLPTAKKYKELESNESTNN